MFTIPVALGIIENQIVPSWLVVFLYGLVTVPVGYFCWCGLLLFQVCHLVLSCHQLDPYCHYRPYFPRIASYSKWHYQMFWKSWSNAVGTGAAQLLTGNKWLLELYPKKVQKLFKKHLCCCWFNRCNLGWCFWFSCCSFTKVANKTAFSNR